MRTELVLDALEMAIWTRQQAGVSDLAGLVAHGSQYLSLRYTERLAEAALRRSQHHERPDTPGRFIRPRGLLTFYTDARSMSCRHHVALGHVSLHLRTGGLLLRRKVDARACRPSLAGPR